MTVTTSDGKELTAKEDPGELLDDDFPGTELSLTFAASEKEKFIVVMPKYSKRADGDAMFLVSLQNPDGDYGVAENYNSLYGTIIDEDEPETVKVGFSDTVYSAREGKAYVEVTREGAINNMVRVLIYTQDGSAESGYDYSKVSAELYFPLGVTKRTVEIPVENGYEELDFTVKFASPVGCEIVSDTAEVVIEKCDVSASLYGSNDDSYPSVGTGASLNICVSKCFGNAEYKSSEGRIYACTSKADYNEECRIEIGIDDYKYYYDGVRIGWKANAAIWSYGNIKMYSDGGLILNLKNNDEAKFDRCTQNFYFGYTHTYNLKISVVQTSMGPRDMSHLFGLPD